GAERGAAAQRPADVRGERADVGSLGAFDRDGKPRPLEREAPDGMDLDVARGAFDLLARTRVLVEPAAVHVQRRVHRRRLALMSDERGEHLVDALRRNEHLAARGHLAFGIAARRLEAELEHRVVGLARADQEARELGGFAEHERKEPGRERIERAGVAALARAEEPLRPRERLRGAEARGLVEQQHALAGVDARRHGAPQPAGLPRGLRGRGAGFTASSMRRESRTPRSTDSSYSNASSGTVRVVRRWASWLRRKPAARCRSSRACCASEAAPSTVKYTFAC